MEREQSEFNSAVSYLNRLNALLLEADVSSDNGDANGWYSKLLILYRELSTEMKTDEKKTLRQQLDKIHEEVQLHNHEVQRGNVSVPKNLYDGLADIEIEFRRVMREAGLQQKVADDVRKKL